MNGDPQRAKKIWQDNFLVPFSNALSSSLADPNDADSSPILETIQAVTVNEFIGRTDQKKLIVVSDMLQNSGVVSFYKDGIKKYDDISAQPLWPKVKPLLSGASVEYFVLGRQSSKVVTSDLKHFWCITWEAAAKNESPVLGDNCLGWHDLVGLGLARAAAVVQVLLSDPRLRGVHFIALSAGQLLKPNGDFAFESSKIGDPKRRRLEVRIRCSKDPCARN